MRSHHARLRNRGPGGQHVDGTFWQRLVRGTRRLRQHPSWERFAGPDWPERSLEVGRTNPRHAKQGRTITPWVLHAADSSLAVFLKCHFRLPWWRRLLALLWPRGTWSPALQEWDHLEWARAQGLPVPQPLAGGELIGPWGRLQSFLAVEELTGMWPLHEAIPAAAAGLGTEAFRRWKRGLAVELARLSRSLHERRRFHKDLYLCHFFITEGDTHRPPSDWAGRVRLIDLHRLAHHPWMWRWWQAKDLGQLLFSSELSGITARDRLYFWRAYHGSDRKLRRVRWLREVVRLRAWTYLRHERRPKRRRPNAPLRPHAGATPSQGSPPPSTQKV